MSLAELEFLLTLPLDAYQWAFGPSPPPRTVVTLGRETGRIPGTISHRVLQIETHMRYEAVVNVGRVWYSSQIGVVETGSSHNWKEGLLGRPWFW